MAKVKQSNFELLKVVAMLMIVCHHLITQIAFNIDTQLTGLFFMVSAWFLCIRAEAFQMKKSMSRIWSLEKVMLFYSIGIPLTFSLVLTEGGG